MVIVMVALAERDQRDPPAVPAGILCAVRLIAPDVADGVDAEGRVQDGKGSADAGQQKTPYAPRHAIGEIADDERQP